eukprot:948530_1
MKSLSSPLRSRNRYASAKRLLVNARADSRSTGSNGQTSSDRPVQVSDKMTKRALRQPLVPKTHNSRLGRLRLKPKSSTSDKENGGTRSSNRRTPEWSKKRKRISTSSPYNAQAFENVLQNSHTKPPLPSRKEAASPGRSKPQNTDTISACNYKEMESRLKDMIFKQESLQVKFERQQHSVDTLESKNKKLRVQYKSLEKEKIAWVSEKKSMKSEIQKYEQQTSNFMSEKERMERLIDQLQQEMKELRTSRDRYQSKYNASRKLRDSFLKKLSSAKLMLEDSKNNETQAVLANLDSNDSPSPTQRRRSVTFKDSSPTSSSPEIIVNRKFPAQSTRSGSRNRLISSDKKPRNTMSKQSKSKSASTSKRIHGEPNVSGVNFEDDPIDSQDSLSCINRNVRKTERKKQHSKSNKETNSKSKRHVRHASDHISRDSKASGAEPHNDTELSRSKPSRPDFSQHKNERPYSDLRTGDSRTNTQGVLETPMKVGEGAESSNRPEQHLGSDHGVSISLPHLSDCNSQSPEVSQPITRSPHMASILSPVSSPKDDSSQFSDLSECLGLHPGDSPTARKIARNLFGDMTPPAQPRSKFNSEPPTTCKKATPASQNSTDQTADSSSIFREMGKSRRRSRNSQLRNGRLRSKFSKGRKSGKTPASDRKSINLTDVGSRKFDDLAETENPYDRLCLDSVPLDEDSFRESKTPRRENSPKPNGPRGSFALDDLVFEFTENTESPSPVRQSLVEPSLASPLGCSSLGKSNSKFVQKDSSTSSRKSVRSSALKPITNTFKSKVTSVKNKNALGVKQQSSKRRRDEPDYAYIETVRGKKRQDLEGSSCPRCKNFYTALNVVMPGIDTNELCKCVSRHRAKYKIPSTPPGFWSAQEFTNVSGMSSAQQ